jgi:hypothetical protein
LGIAVWYAVEAKLNSVNAARFVTDLRAQGFNDETLRQCAEYRIERIKDEDSVYAGLPVPDVNTAMKQCYHELLNVNLLGLPEDEYYTPAQLVRKDVRIRLWQIRWRIRRRCLSYLRNVRA